ncbi:MAG TPA: hypothetical protein VLL08_27605 [Kineosporiaceae bacterium]|nr:hypothetical protein [Kineosporiaceae bacterium]
MITTCPQVVFDRFSGLVTLGRSLLVPSAAACTWAEEHWDELLDARELSH